jgi:hypothetical protein
VENTTMTGTLTRNENPKSKDIIDDSQNGEGKLETIKPGSGHDGGDLTSKGGAKASSGGKNNFMSYFTKK